MGKEKPMRTIIAEIKEKQIGVNASKLKGYHGLSDEKMANALGIKRLTYINKINNGGRKHTEVLSLCSLLEVEMEDLHKGWKDVWISILLCEDGDE